MITIFNRVEVLVTFEMKRQAEIRAILAQHKIPYSLKVVDFNSPSPMSAGRRAYTGTLGEKARTEYIFYVRKKDKETADYVIRNS